MWEIWHTYSTYLLGRDLDLKAAGSRLASEELAYLIMHKDGWTCLRTDEGVTTGQTDLRLDTRGTSAEYRFNRETGPEPDTDSFAFECWRQACHFRFSEKRLFHVEDYLPHPYIRIFLGPCHLLRFEDTKRVRAYVTVLLYETGVVVVEFRTIAPDRAYGLDEFIDKAVNLFKEPFDMAEVPPALARFAPRMYTDAVKPQPLRRRLSVAALNQRHDRAIAQATERYEAGDYTFPLAPLTREDDPAAREQLQSLALTIINIIAYVSAGPRDGWRYVLYGQVPLLPQGSFWTGRPHIYLCEFSHQQETASENIAVFRDEMARIFMRAPALPTREHRHLPDDARLFDDYSAFVDKQASLWVWAKQGLKQQEEWADKNRGHLVYEHQVAMELLEYGYMLNRSNVDQLHQHGAPEAVLRARKDLIRLERHMSETSGFGEIRKMLVDGWARMGVPDLRRAMREGLAIQEALTSLHEARESRAFGTGLAVLFGFVAVPSLAHQVLQPLWLWLGWPRPGSDDAFGVMLVAVAIVLVGVVVAIIARRTGQNDLSQGRNGA